MFIIREDECFELGSNFREMVFDVLEVQFIGVREENQNILLGFFQLLQCLNHPVVHKEYVAPEFCEQIHWQLIFPDLKYSANLLSEIFARHFSTFVTSNQPAL